MVLYAHTLDKLSQSEPILEPWFFFYSFIYLVHCWIPIDNGIANVLVNNGKNIVYIWYLIIKSWLMARIQFDNKGLSY